MAADKQIETPEEKNGSEEVPEEVPEEVYEDDPFYDSLETVPTEPTEPTEPVDPLILQYGTEIDSVPDPVEQGCASLLSRP